jgi:integrase
MLRIVPVSNNPYYSFCIDGIKTDGKRKRIFCRTEKEAKAELKRIDAQLRSEGEAGLDVSDATRVLGKEASELLEPYGKNILDAARFYTAHLRSLADSVQVSQLVDEYQEAKRKANFSQSYLHDIRQRLSRFIEVFGLRSVRTLKAGEIEEWLHGLGLGPVSVNNYRAVVRAFLAYAVKRGYIDTNPVASIDKIRVGNDPPEIFTPVQLATVLAAAPVDLLPALAIGAFAGLRASEVLRLDWSAVDLRRGYIHVAARKSKSARRRLVKILPNLAAWLAPYANAKGKVLHRQKRAYHDAVAGLVGTIGLEWPQNGLRHSFASYHLAKFEDAAQLMLQLGHTTTRLIFEAYRELVTPEAAELYWSIMPAGVPANVVSIAAAQ